MSFYGNISNAGKTQMSFDRVYPNRKIMEENASTDGVFVGRFVLIEYDDNTMDEIISTTALYVRERLIPVINQVFDLNSYIEYLKKYSIDLLWDCDSFKGESLILIKADNHDDFQKFFQEKVDETNAQIDAGMLGVGYTKEDCYNDHFHGIIERVVYPRDKVYSDKNLYNEALEEAERRKKENIKKLYSYKVLKN